MKSGNSLIWGVVYSLLSLGIVVTNAFAIFIFAQRRFVKKRSQYLLINLAVTDFLVGAISQPLYVIVVTSHHSTVLRQAYLTADIIAGMASVSTITLISLERLVAVGWPWKHRLLKTRHYIIAIISTWLYAILIRILLTRNISRYLFILCHGIPFPVTLVSCILIVLLKKRSDKSLRQSINQQNTRLLQSMLIVILVSWMTWLPFYICNSLAITDHSCWPLLLQLFKLFHYSNSILNPIIYSTRLPIFRSTLREMFCRSRNEQEQFKLINRNLRLQIPSKEQKT